MEPHEQQSILRALREYDRQYPLNDYDNWLNSNRYSVALEWGGRLYPPKKVYEIMTGEETPNFNTQNATGEFEDWGFKIIDKPGATRHNRQRGTS